jgi:hypothetical protein
MPDAKEPIRAPIFQRGRADLSKQSRPIGSGAVAAALAATGRREPDAGQASILRIEEDREIEPIAA